MVVRFARIAAVLAAVTTALAVPLVVLAGGSGKRQTPPTFAFGRTGGNIVPFTVTIAANGHVSTTGTQDLALTQATVPLRNGLAKLAKAEGFWTMATALTCGKVNPDIAGRFIRITGGGKTRMVTARGTCYPAFEELYAVLGASVGAGP
jgi:hypothetical protein